VTEQQNDPLDDLLQAGLAIPYHPAWNGFTGSPLASILLRRILDLWRAGGRRPFARFMAPCAASAQEVTWIEELRCTQYRFEKARAAIARRVLKGVSWSEALRGELVIYRFDSRRRTWYALNEVTLARRLADLSGSLVAEPAISVFPEYAPAPLTTYPANSGIAKKVTPDYGATCTNNNVDVVCNSYEDVGMDQKQGLLSALAELGDANPEELLTRYPAAAIRSWLAYCNSPQGANLHNKPGFLRYKLRQLAEAEELKHRGASQPRRGQGKPRATAAERKTAGQRPREQSRPPPAPEAPGERPTDGADYRPIRRPPSEPERIWDETKEELKVQMAADTFTFWLQCTRGFALEDGTLRVAVESEMIQDWLAHRMRGLIERTLARVAGLPHVEFVVAPQIVFPPPGT
jgi:hypothetical protein